LLVTKFVTRRVSSNTVTLKLSETHPTVVVVNLDLDVVRVSDSGIGVHPGAEAVDVKAVRWDVKSLVEAGDIVPVDTDCPRSVGTRIGKVDDVIKDRIREKPWCQRLRPRQELRC